MNLLYSVNVYILRKNALPLLLLTNLPIRTQKKIILLLKDFLNPITHNDLSTSKI